MKTDRFTASRVLSPSSRLENNPQDAEQPLSRLKSQLGQSDGIQDRIHRPENDSDEQCGRHIFANQSGPAALLKQRAEMLADNLRAAPLDQREDFRRTALHVAHERGLDFLHFMLQAGQKLVQLFHAAKRPIGVDPRELEPRRPELFEDHRLQKCLLAWKKRVKRLLADREFGREVVRRNGAEPVREEVPPARSDDPAGKRGLPTSWRERCFFVAVWLSTYGGNYFRYS